MARWSSRVPHLRGAETLTRVGNFIHKITLFFINSRGSNRSRGLSPLARVAPSSLTTGMKIKVRNQVFRLGLVLLKIVQFRFSVYAYTTLCIILRGAVQVLRCALYS